jgi:hypothetical protein
VSPDEEKEKRQANAGKSTGPRTRHGKSRSSLNAVTHGAFAKAAVIPGEDPEAFTALRASLWRDLAPDGALEEVLVHRIALCLWRLARATRAEGELLKQVGEPLHARAFIDPTSRISEILIGSAFSETSQTRVERINRYETTIDRLLQRSLDELDRARARRADREQAVTDGGLPSEPAPKPATPVVNSLEELIEICTPSTAESSTGNGEGQ